MPGGDWTAVSPVTSPVQYGPDRPADHPVRQLGPPDGRGAGRGGGRLERGEGGGGGRGEDQEEQRGTEGLAVQGQGQC